ncbi:type II toxin-antitoxin system death-on-curing family toxin [Atopomonas sediminilitoris]|uniref:type II toxin-antitoxin system death-on-curing family toxin n=1 Tax=Atopomonas sediminilitoris TaxID=2919919 RepID=UPI001F4D4436|nr:type II toxin-antitoxin system death-on-curing family toxin [Atopomonas sediminilitoris]MCJ8170764.1 type II toxin-antitoxin system death-on-curing family toxin [Atopomonas sediminilitoris]
MADLTLYFDAQHAVDVHDWIIEHSGGLPGLKDLGQLESVLQHIQNDDYYPTFDAKLTHLIFAINKFHAFNDGNKRSSLTLGAYFLTLNGYDYCVPQFFVQMENIVVAVAEGKINKELLQRLVISLIQDDDFPEDLKLELLESLGA